MGDLINLFSREKKELEEEERDDIEDAFQQIIRKNKLNLDKVREERLKNNKSITSGLRRPKGRK